MAMTLVGCEEIAAPSQSSFQTQYLQAREALETGRYDRAVRQYQRLMRTAGPLEPRVRLELAHSYLRGGDYEEALREARILAQTQTDQARAAALAVQATADHELALIAIDRGDGAGTGRSHLIRARNAIDEVLGSYESLDPMGALASRRRGIAELLEG